MMMIPMQSHDHKNDRLVLILEPDNVARLREADPCEAHGWPQELINPRVTVCYEEPTAELNQVLHSGNIELIMTYLTRGWKFRPERGDHDDGPQRIADLN